MKKPIFLLLPWGGVPWGGVPWGGVCTFHSTVISATYARRHEACRMGLADTKPWLHGPGRYKCCMGLADTKPWRHGPGRYQAMAAWAGCYLAMAAWAGRLLKSRAGRLTGQMGRNALIQLFKHLMYNKGRRCRFQLAQAGQAHKKRHG